MLSRDAEHLYWLTRYVERIENTARMINVHSELMLDFPGDQSLGWKPIIETMAVSYTHLTLPTRS